MEFSKVVKSRRSIRAYKNTLVADEDIKRLLEYAHTAPTAGNLVPWEFVIVKDEGIRRKMVDTTFRGNNIDGDKHQEWLMQAPVLIAIAADKEKSVKKYGEMALKTLIYLDCSACIQNILLGAVDMGLASCYISGFRGEELRDVLGFDDGHEIIAFLPIGYGDMDGIARPKCTLESITYYDKYTKHE